MTPECRSASALSYFEGKLECTRCRASFKRMDADFRDVPTKPIDGIPSYELVPICPACKKPLLFDVK